jgi:hypothetical protein
MIRHAEAVVGDETRCDRTRLVAGTCAALAHGCLRWSDLQRLTELRLTRTALAGRSWRIKNQGTRTRPWAAVRVGISGDDWAAPFVALRDEVLRGHPDADWCPPRPDGDDLLPGLPATYADALLAMRRLLTEPPLSLDWTEACTFSLHSWRHWLPTATNQLNVAKEDRCTVGHWSANSAMPDRYDAAACVRELAVKSAVVAAYRRGWRRVGDFEIPLPEPMPPAGSAPAGSAPAAGDMAPPAPEATPPAGTEPPKADDEQPAPAARLFAEDDPSISTRLRDDLRFAVSATTKRCHAFEGDATTSCCGCWTPEEAVLTAATVLPPRDCPGGLCMRCFAEEADVWRDCDTGGWATDDDDGWSGAESDEAAYADDSDDDAPLALGE